MGKYLLGERVRYTGYMYRYEASAGKKWRRLPVAGEGIIVGKRTVSDGYTENWGEGNVYTETARHSFWLVAHNLSGYRYVAEDDIVSVEQARCDGTDGYDWLNKTTHSLAAKEVEDEKRRTRQ